MRQIGPTPEYRLEADERILRHLGVRLAALTYALLSLLLLALGISVYLTMQQSLLQPIRQAVQSRALAEMDSFDELAASAAEHPGRVVIDSQEQGGVFITFADRHLAVLGGSPTPFGNGRVLPDTRAAGNVLRNGAAVYTTRNAAGENYLIYTRTVRSHGRTAGVVETGISKAQYEDALTSLITVLVVVGVVGLLGIGTIGLFIVRRALVPVRLSLRRQRDFVADAAHELRTPIAIIQTAAELGLASDDPSEQQAALGQALNESAHLTRLIGDLSLLARADSGALSLEREPLDLAQLTAGTVGDILPVAEHRRITLDLHTQPVIVAGDDTRLRQLLLILLDNAMRYAGDGGRIEIAVTRRGDRAELSVSDSGPGIPPDDLPHVFDRFYRSSRSRPSEGSGLGLSIAQQIAHAHGGTISASNGPTGGAVFRVILPLAPVPQSAARS